MGGGSWDTKSYVSSASSRRSAGIADFDYDAKVKSGAASGVHASLDPKKVAGSTSPLAGKNVRESRDGPDHPESLPIAFFFDVTGSMGEIPIMLQKKVATLMDVILAKAGVKDPQILVGAIGDSTCDRYPFQVGQFESDNRFEEALRSIIIERGGGGQNMESYALAYRFMAYHTATDAWEKRGKKGYLFTMGDEMPWPTVTSRDVYKLFGVESEKDETVEELLAKVREKWEVFHLFSKDGSYANDTRVHERWRTLLGERFVMVEDSSLVCEIIAGLVHMLETAADVDTVVADIGVKGAAGTAVKNALVPVSRSVVPSHVAKGTLAHKKGKTPGVSTI